MNASLHIAGTQSSVLDSVFVCRRKKHGPRADRQAELLLGAAAECRSSLRRDAQLMAAAGVRVAKGDLRCLGAGHIARLAVNFAARIWVPRSKISERMRVAGQVVKQIASQVELESLVASILAAAARPGNTSEEADAPSV
jgi:hypothetical protein